MRKLMHFSYSHPWIVLLIIFSISIFFAFQVDKLRQDPSAEGMMIDGDPDKLIYEETIKIFGTDKMSVIFIRDKKLFTPRKLKIIENLVYDLEDLPGSIKVESLFSVTNFKIEDGLLNNAPLIEGVPESKKETLQIRKDVLRNPLLVGNIVSKDGRALAIKVYMDHDSDDPNFNKKFTERIELLLKPLQPDFQKIYQYGNSYFHTVMSNMMVQDQRRLVPLSLIVLILTLLATTRSLNGAILPLLTSGISILWTLGFMGIVGIPVNILTIIVPSLIIVIGSTEDIHLLSEFTEGIHLKNTRDLAFKFMVSKMGMVVMVTALTTFLGFLSICANKITILRQFGMAASFAMLVNPLVTSLLTPVYFMFIKVAKNDQEKKSPGQKRRSFLEKMAEGFTNIVINRKKGVLILSFFLAAIIGSFGVLVQLDNDIVAVFKKDSPVVQRVNEINKELSGSQYFSIRISGGHKKIFKDPKNLEQIAAIQAFISNRKLFDKSVSLVDLLKLINRELHGGETSGNIIPGSTEEISQYLLLLSDRDLERYVTFDFSEVNIFISHNLSSSYELKGAINELRAFMEKTLNPHFKFYFTGENILTLKAADTIATGQAKSIALLLLVIFIIMSVMFLNVKAGLISLLPNILPIIFYFGVMGIFSIPLNIGTAMVAAIAIGISVDDTIHFMIRFNNEMHRLKNQEQAMRLCISTEIQPVFSTSVSLALGFLVLAFSNFSTIICLTFTNGIFRDSLFSNWSINECLQDFERVNSYRNFR